MRLSWFILFFACLAAVNGGGDHDSGHETVTDVDTLDTGHETQEEQLTSDLLTKEQSTLHVDLAVACVFFFLVIGTIVTFYFINCKCEGIFPGQRSDTLKHLTWTWIGLVASIFIAVNLFYLELLIIESIHAEWHHKYDTFIADLGALSVSFCIAQAWVLLVVLFFFVQDAAAHKGYIVNWRYWRIIIMPCFIKITSHIEGFAMLHFMAFGQDWIVKLFCIDGQLAEAHGDAHHRLLSGAGQSGCPYLDWPPLWVVVAGGFCLGLVIAVVSMQFWYRVVKYCVLYDDINRKSSLHQDFHPDPTFVYDATKRLTFSGKQRMGYAELECYQSYENLDHLWGEFSIEALAIASSYCFMRVLLALYTNSMPGIYKIVDGRTDKHLVIWFISTFVLTIAAVAWFVKDVIIAAHRERMQLQTRSLKAARGVHEEEEEEEEVYFRDEFCSQFLNMSVAWGWVQFTRWMTQRGFEFYGDVKSELVQLIFSAMLLTFVAYCFLVPVGFLKDYLNETYGTHLELTDLVVLPAVNKGISDLVAVLSLMAAFMWELVMEVCLQGMAKAAIKFSHYDSPEELEAALAEDTSLTMCWVAPIFGSVLIPMYCCWAFPKSIHDGNAANLPVGLFPDSEGNCDCRAHFDVDPEEYEEDEELSSEAAAILPPGPAGAAM